MSWFTDLLFDLFVSEYLWLLVGIGLIVFGAWVWFQGKKLEALSKLDSKVDNVGGFLMLLGIGAIAAYYFLDSLINNFYFRSIFITIAVLVLIIYLLFRIPVKK